MARVCVLGGTGYAGAAIVAEAARRGHEVTAVSRKPPAEPVRGQLAPPKASRVARGATLTVSSPCRKVSAPFSFQPVQR